MDIVASRINALKRGKKKVKKMLLQQQQIEEEYQVIDYRLVANHEMRNIIM